MTEIQRKIVKQSGRTIVCRIFQARNDKDTIATWQLDLGRILQVFNVRSVYFTWPTLIVHSKTELALNTHVTVSDIRHDVSKIQEEIGGQGSVSRVQSVDNKGALAVVSVQTGSAETRSEISTTNKSDTLLSHLAYLESLLPRHREPASDATS